MVRASPSPSQPLTEDERRALRGSKFAPLPAPPPPSFRPQPRLAHPGGPVTTNKAAALAKFLERKLQQPNGLKSIDTNLVELAVKNAKETVNASKGGPSTSGRTVRHVASFEDTYEESGEDQDKLEEAMQKKRKKKKKLMTDSFKDSDEDVDDIEEAKQKKRKKKREKDSLEDQNEVEVEQHRRKRKKKKKKGQPKRS